MSETEFRVAKWQERGFVIDALVNFAKEHEDWEEDDATGEPLDSKEVEETCRWDDRDSVQTKKHRDHTIYPLIQTMNDQLIGFCFLAHREDKDAKQKDGWVIMDFAILKPFRRKKLGANFIKKVIDFCYTYSHTKPCFIEASSHVNNKIARTF
jgi:predicted GNAT family N-acyltransferase